MATRCFTPIFGKRIRLKRLNDCCSVVTTGTAGECLEVISDGFISISLSSETEDGNEVTVKKASGAIHTSMKSPDSFKRFTVEMELTGVDPEFLAFVSNMRVYKDGENSIGVTAYEGVVSGKFSVELWTGMAGQACTPGVDEASGYFLLPCVNAGMLGDLEINGEDAVSFSMSGAYTVSGNAWGIGTDKVVLDELDAPALLPVALKPDEPLLILETGVAPPPASCGCSKVAAS